MPIDLFHLPASPGMFGSGTSFRTDVQVFQYTGLAQAFQLWSKPKGASMCFMWLCSGGGGGGAGFTRASGNPGGGGGSGASSNQVRAFRAAVFLPDVLYVRIGPGGLGGVAGVSAGAGGAGTNSFVCTSKTAVLPNIVAYSGTTVPGGGGGGAVGAAGAAGAIPVGISSQPGNSWGFEAAQTGLAGVAGGAHTGSVGSNATAWGVQCLSPGGGGGGIATTTEFGGGTVLSTALADFGSQGYYNTNIVVGGVTGGGVLKDGNPGRMEWKPFMMTGGSGGASNNGGIGGIGGNAGIGCGGGGGGAGTTGGPGGHGGPGLVVVISW